MPVYRQSGVTVDFNQAAAAPAINVEVTVPASVKSRRVYGTVDISGGISEGSQILWQVEDAVGSGVFETVVGDRVAEATGTFHHSFSFEVAGGRKYKWINGGIDGDVNEIDDYNYVDIS